MQINDVKNMTLRKQFRQELRQAMYFTIQRFLSEKKAQSEKAAFYIVWSIAKHCNTPTGYKMQDWENDYRSYQIWKIGLP